MCEEMTEVKIEKVKVSSAEIVVHGTREKPYYEIEYFDLSDMTTHIGYSSYKLDTVFGYLDKYFEKVESEPESEKNMGDLISREAALNLIRNIAESRSLSTFECYLYGDIYDGIKKIDTSYDVDAVCEELKKATGDIHYTEDASFDGKCIEDFEFIQAKTALEIVRNGGKKE